MWGWSGIQEQPPGSHPDGDSACTGGPESKLPATSSLQSLFDEAGRLDLAGLRKVVAERGTDASERRVTWKFLFGVYPAGSTAEERRRLDQQLATRYRSMRSAWRRQFPSAGRMKVQSDLELSLAIETYEAQQGAEADEGGGGVGPGRRLTQLPPRPQHSQWVQSLSQPQFLATLRDIDADVPRTDRHRSFFQRQGLVKLLYLREILITFVAFHQDIGYCQGMNDFASRFLQTLDSEFDAFWCFATCMRRWAPSLSAQGVARRIQTTEELLQRVDPELYHHIARTSEEKLLFCLGWLLLRFQRELGHEDAARVMELGALEGDPAELAPGILSPPGREGEEGLAPRLATVSFEVLLCVALLIQHRRELLQHQHVHDFFLFAHRLQGKLALDALQRADGPL
ncbi:TBC1 domain family member 25-like [Pelodiscus sinensis]|uniref:TBC1 domain family member 25-like n=1 Tax=Pelodiscus sinensis TaxID=13735 RepID=UPI003F6B49CF